MTEGDRRAGHAARGGLRSDVQLPAVHDPAALHLAGADRPRGCTRRRGDLYAKPSTTFRKVTFPLSMPGVVSGTLLTFIPASRRLRQRRTARLHGHPDGRQRHPVAVPAGPRLPDGRRAVLHPHGGHPDHGHASTSARPGRRIWSDGACARWLSATSSSSRACCTLGYLILPNVVVMVFSFNKPAGPLQLRLAAVLHRRLEATRAASPTCAARSSLSLQIALLGDARRHRPRHDDRLRAGPLPLPGARRGQLADLPADGDARGRHGRLAAAPSSSTLGASSASGRSSSRTSCSA